MAEPPIQGDEGAILDRIFRDPATKHGLRIFDAADFRKLELRDENGKAYVTCAVTERKRLAKPEEVIRQLMVHKLAEELRYPISRMSVEVPVRMGSAYASKKADIVVYTDESKVTPYIIVETKKPRRKDGLDQLNSYMHATGVYFGCWTNGDVAAYQLRIDPNLFEELQRLPAADETLDDVKEPIKKRDLKPIQDLKEEVQYLEDAVLANAGVSSFEEIFKLIFAKLHDEFGKADNEAMDFRTTTADPKEQYERINSLFRQAAEEWSDIFSPADKIELSPQALVAVASTFQLRRFYDADLDVIDAAFEYMINPEQKGDKGQYFTPRPVVKMCVRMLNPHLNESVLDPACGPGGFLIHALHWVAERYLRPRFATELDRKRFDYANSRLFGIDFDRRLTRVAKAMMLIAGDGRANIYRVNSLDPREWSGRTDGLSEAVRDGSFDIVMTNPPFAGSINQAEILGRYDLAYKGQGDRRKRVNSLTRDVLFTERCLRFLKPGGRMAIVLPQGNLNNTNAEYIRAWVMDQARVLGVVGLHGNTFKPFTGTKTSVLFLQKLGNSRQRVSDYPIFMGVNRRSVKDNSGNYLFKQNEDGSFVTDSNGKRVIDHDLDEVADGFIEFAQAEGLDFWKE